MKKKKTGLLKGGYSSAGRGERIIVICTVLLLILGFLMAASIAYRDAYYSVKEAGLTIAKHAIFIVCFGICYFIAKRLFQYKYLRWGFWIAIPAYLILMFLVPIIGIDMYGAKSWLQVGPVTIQPSEFAKPLMIALNGYCVHRAVRKSFTAKQGFQNMLKVFGPCLALLLITCGLLVLQKDYGTMIIVSGISLSCFMIPAMGCLTKWQRLSQLCLGIALLSGFALFFATDIGTKALSKFSVTNHIVARVENTKNPYTDITGNGYQAANALYGIADSDIVGKGYGNSNRKYGFLTQSESDFVLVIVVEELGIFGLFLIFICYGGITFQLFRYAFRAHHQSDKVVLGGTAAYFLLHFFINVGGVGCLIPLTGVPLLLVSAGGTSIMATGIALGMAQSCILRVKQEEAKRKKEKAQSYMLKNILTPLQDQKV